MINIIHTKQSKHSGLKKNARLWKSWTSCKEPYIIFFCSFFRFVLPFALSKMVAYFEDGSTISKSDLYLYAALLISLNIVNTLYTHNYQQMITEIGIKVRTAITALVYRKALKLGPSAISDVTMGKIVTLITRDVMSFENALLMINDIWISCFHIVLISYMIYKKIGWSVLAGVGFYLATIPLQRK